LSEALALGCGVCQDFAHLFLGACRGLGLPARYVSGYVRDLGELATHAWCQVWAGEQAGWVDVDPTQGKIVGDEHVVTAVGRDYADVPPNRGVWKGKAEETINVAVLVELVERLPPDWSQLGEQHAWAGFTYTQLQGPARGRHYGSTKARIRHQQGQQQQVGRGE
jgi:transglutaminase-like putative cysteine protease